jgi:hypothetical protein
VAGTLYDGYLVQAIVAGASNSHTVVRGIEAYDATVFCGTSAAGGTVQVGKNGTALTDAMTCATAKNVDRADTFDNAQRLFVTGDTMNFTVASGAIGIVTVHCFVTGSGAAG